MAWYRLVNGHNTFKAYIKVYSRTVGAIASATDGTYTYTAIVGSDGYASIKVIKAGTYTVSCTGTTKTISLTISSEGTYTAQYTWNRFLVGTKYTEVKDTTLTSRAIHRTTSIDEITVTHKDSGTVTATFNEDTGRWALTNTADALITVSTSRYSIPDRFVPLFMGEDENGYYIGTADASTLYVASDTSENPSITHDGLYWYLHKAEKWTAEPYSIKGTADGTVYDNYPDAYPNDGISGDRWYVAA